MTGIQATDCECTHPCFHLSLLTLLKQPLVLTWAVNNQGGALKRGVGSAIVVSMGNAGGIISSLYVPSTCSK